jgi:2'-5' RNA ligase
MKLAIVAYPQIAPSDLEWIENFRALHDPQSSRIAVHFTLVFPFEGTSADLGPELAATAQAFPPISFAIREATVVREGPNSSHVFLVPGEGDAQIRALHDRLYSGLLRTHLRAEMPFVPHMTIGAAADTHEAEQLALEIAAAAPLIAGQLTALEVVDVGGTQVRPLAAHRLTGAPARG